MTVWLVKTEYTTFQGAGCSCCADAEFTHTDVEVWTDETAALRRAEEIKCEWANNSGRTRRLEDVEVEEQKVRGRK